MTQTLYMAWSDGGEYIAAIYGTSNSRETMEDRIFRESKDRPKSDKLRVVRVTVHVHEGKK